MTLYNSGSGFIRPMATSLYVRVKQRNAAAPTRQDEMFRLTIACCCDENHKPIGIRVSSYNL